MRSTPWTFPVLLLIGLASGAACGGGADPVTPPDDVPQDTIPLDGRGGGVLAYNFWPGPNGGVDEIHAMNADGTGDRRLISASIGLNHVDWSPDAQRLAAVGYYGASYETWSVHTFRADGQGLTRLTNIPGVWDNEPTWSPDGSMIAFSRSYPSQNYRSDIWVMNADGTDQRWIGAEGFTVRWSPDGARMIYQSRLSELAGGQSDIMTCSRDGSDVRAVTDTPEDELTPIWSPDGSRIAFVANYDGDFDIYVMNPDGTDTRRVTENAVDDYSPRWSPDGTRIAFSSDSSGTGRWEVYVIGADGANLRQVTHSPAGGTSTNPVWRPNPR